MVVKNIEKRIYSVPAVKGVNVEGHQLIVLCDLHCCKCPSWGIRDICLEITRYVIFSAGFQNSSGNV